MSRLSGKTDNRTILMTMIPMIRVNLKNEERGKMEGLRLDRDAEQHLKDKGKMFLRGGHSS